MIQKIRSDAVTSYNILDLSILIGFCGLLIIISITIESFIEWMGKKFEKKNYQQLEWMSNNILQLQRFAHEELNCGIWIEKNIPVTTALETLAILDISEPSHPRLVNPTSTHASVVMMNPSSPVMAGASSPLTNTSSHTANASSSIANASPPTADASSPTANASSPTADASSSTANASLRTADAFSSTTNASVATMNVSPPLMNGSSPQADLSSPIANISSMIGNASPPLMDISLFLANPSSPLANPSSPMIDASSLPMMEEASTSTSASASLTGISSQDNSDRAMLDTQRWCSWHFFHTQLEHLFNVLSKIFIWPSYLLSPLSSR